MPKYDVQCSHCGEVDEIFMSYQEYDDLGMPCHLCEDGEYGIYINIPFSPPIHYKGYGFFKTDNADKLERFNRDHYDGSGRNAETKTAERRIKHPESTVPAYKKS